MPFDANKIIVRRYFEELLNIGNLQVASKILARNFVFHSSRSAVPIKGIEDFKHFLSAFHKAFPTARFTPEEEIVEKNRVAGRFSVRGIQKTQMGTSGLTNNSVEMSGVNIFHLKDGKITEIWIFSNEPELMNQLGMFISQTEVIL